ncbi:MAG: hypothetical protein ABIE22_05200 [archaeon]
MKKRIAYLLVAIFLVAVFLNLLWEVSQSSLYDWQKEPLKNDVNFYVGRILKSTLGDGIFILIIFLLISAYRRGFIWINKTKRLDYILLSTFGLVFAALIEIKAQIYNSWHYGEIMPTVFGLGITPLVQLAITGTLTLIIVRKLE